MSKDEQYTEIKSLDDIPKFSSEELEHEKDLEAKEGIAKMVDKYSATKSKNDKLDNAILGSDCCNCCECLECCECFECCDGL